MAVSEDHVRRVFRALENGHRGKFLDHVADNVDWIVEGAHSLVAHYRFKGNLLSGSFANRIVPPGAPLVVEQVTVKDDEAVVELRSLATAKDGWPVRHALLLGCPFCRRDHRSGSGLSRLGNASASL